MQCRRYIRRCFRYFAECRLHLYASWVMHIVSGAVVVAAQTVPHPHCGRECERAKPRSGVERGKGRLKNALGQFFCAVHRYLRGLVRNRRVAEPIRECFGVNWKIDTNQRWP